MPALAAALGLGCASAIAHESVKTRTVLCGAPAQAAHVAHLAAKASGAPALPSAAHESFTDDPCPRPAAGSDLPEPEDLRSAGGVLQVDFTYLNFPVVVHASPGERKEMHYCYLYKDGSQAPTLRLHPGDWLILRLKNRLREWPGAPSPHPAHAMTMPTPTDACGGGTMDGWSTNLHFHGLTVPAVCHQDDVLKTLIPPGAPPFEYRFQIPADEPSGVYWYHPHVHGFSNVQVQGGASGALIVEGIEHSNHSLAGMPERVLIVRDQPLLNPDAPPSKSSAVPVPVLRDAEGDILNMGTGTGKPSRDLSLNFVPVPYPDYPPASIVTRPGRRELWRFLNAAAITYVDLQILANGLPQPLGLASLDGTPIDEGGKSPNRILWQSHLFVPPGGRVDFIFKTPPEGIRATLVAGAVDTGPAGENDPGRPLASIVSRADAPEPSSALPAVTADAASAPAPHAAAWLGDIQPVRERKLYFSEQPSDPNDPNSPTAFFITVEGQKPAVYDPHSKKPNIVVHQGDVEDWIIENRSRELHAFHIHQLHFLMVGWGGVPLNDTLLRDTVNVPYWDGVSTAYPSVKVRMDFRDPHTVGTFVYHCHLREHEDGGMMGTIEVLPAVKPASSRAASSKPAQMKAR